MALPDTFYLVRYLKPSSLESLTPYGFRNVKLFHFGSRIQCLDWTGLVVPRFRHVTSRGLDTKRGRAPCVFAARRVAGGSVLLWTTDG